MPFQQAAAKTQVLTLLQTWTTTPPDQTSLFRTFVQDALERFRGPFLSHHPPKRALQLLEEAFRFAADAPGQKPRVDLRPRTSGFAVLTHLVDQAFIVDTVRLFLRNRDATWDTGFNVVVYAVRDDAGRLVGVDAQRGRAESLVLCEGHGGALGSDLAAAATQLASQLTLAMAMVADFGQMVETVQSVADAAATEGTNRGTETAEFLRWINKENFVFMGMEHGDRRLGTQSVSSTVAAQGRWSAPHPSGFVRVRKSPEESPVHRAGRIDEVLVEVPGAPPLCIRGLFTYRAITSASRGVPVLRRMLERALEDAAALPGSHRAKGLANVFDSLPTEYLLTTPQSGITHILDLVFEAEQAGDVGATFHRFEDGNALCLVALPRGVWSDDIRREIQDVVTTALSSRDCDHGVFVGRFETVLLHFYLSDIRWPNDDVRNELTRRIRALASPWPLRLWTALSTRYGEDEADRLAERFSHAFADAWQRAESPDRTAADIAVLDRLTAGDVAADLIHAADGALDLTLYEARDLTLSDILPVLDNFGFVVMESRTGFVTGPHGPVHVDRFRIERASGATIAEVISRRPQLLEALQAVFSGTVESDGLNGLVVRAGLSWTDVDVLRSYCRYVRQHQVKVLVVRVREILLANPALCRALVDLFNARFDPDLVGNRATAVESATGAARAALRGIRGYDEDVIFSALFELIDATVRTNRYRTDRESHYLSFKFDCARAARLMGPRRPMFEIYVHSPQVEGVHLRFGKVARGGLRWSDREDYRTEVLSLVTTQLVKNVVIVPTGSKGGFLLKAPSPDPIVRRRQADELYKTFIRGLLDVTDNAKGGTPTRPPRVVCHDDFDPYLVVAADKGTAHLSDTANKLSQSYGFWLDDAFASGGSNGYDHKGVGITARGGWVLVKRHFAEMGRDPYNEPFSCVGIGDMSGDVFGNGLIESDKTLLLAAFNHNHIFFDPNPDAATSFTERRRLFDNPGGWEKYDKTLLSEGGGIFERKERRIPLSPQVQALIGLDASEAEPDLIIHHILKMEVDLFWNGGIGTYVKASDETPAHADDRTNDALRIDATELRARIVGEGGNLGFTQRGRIEAGLRGVKLNTDAIDNSGGVDLSDHEVNLKILLGGVVARGDMSLTERNALLTELTDEVAALVLEDNDVQGRQISRDELRSKRNIFEFGRAIDFVEQNMLQTRDVLRLPTDVELQRRSDRGEGLTRPELAVLSAWVKMYVFAKLLEGDAAAVPGYDALLLNYFPASIRSRFPQEIRGHMLAKEIAMTMATTRVFGDAGAAFYPIMVETTGRSVLEVTVAWLRAEQAAGLDGLRPALEPMCTGPALVASYEAWILATNSVRDVARSWLAARVTPSTNGVDPDAASAALSRLLPSDEATRDAAEEAALATTVGAEVAGRVRRIRNLGLTLRIAAEANACGKPFEAFALHHLAVRRASRLGEVLDGLAHRSGSGRWDPLALGILRSRFQTLLDTLVRRTPNARGTTVDSAEAALRAGPLAPVRAVVDAFLTEPSPAIATLLVLEERVGASFPVA